MRLIVIFVVAAVGVASPASAQRPVPPGVDAVIAPGAVVSVADLPEGGPTAPDGREKPHRVPDAETFKATKRSFGQAHPAPIAGTLAAGSASTIMSPPGALVGLRRSESGGFIPPDTQVAVSANHIFEVVNLEGRIWTKAGSVVKTFGLASFFGLSARTSVILTQLPHLADRNVHISRGCAGVE